MKNLLFTLTFIVFSLILVQNVPAPPPPPAEATPVGGAIPSGAAIAFIVGYGLWRMRK